MRGPSLRAPDDSPSHPHAPRVTTATESICSRPHGVPAWCPSRYRGSGPLRRHSAAPEWVGGDRGIDARVVMRLCRVPRNRTGDETPTMTSAVIFTFAPSPPVVGCSLMP
jgi:hypothetical protein